MRFAHRWRVVPALVLAVFSLGAAEIEDPPSSWHGTECANPPQPAAVKDAVKDESPPPTSKSKKAGAAKGKKATSRLDAMKKDGADYPAAKLAKQDFAEYSLRSANFVNADLQGTVFRNADLEYADFTSAQAAGANFDAADLRCASLRDVDLTGAGLGCFFDNSMRCADLRRADLRNAKLANVTFDQATLDGVVFEPRSNPDARDIASATGLELMTYETNPDALFQLRKQFQDSGFLPQERAITYALNRRQAELSGPYARWFNTVAFDWTTQYGMNPGRALKIWLVVFFICWLIYALFIRFSSSSGIYLVGDDKDAAPRKIERQAMRGGHGLSSALRSLAQEGRLVGWAGFFSLTSAFNIGFHELNLGQWLHLLTRSDFKLKAEGWARSIAGVQSVISMYLMALWVLTYFGHPFH